MIHTHIGVNGYYCLLMQEFNSYKTNICLVKKQLDNSSKVQLWLLEMIIDVHNDEKRYLEIS